MNIKPVTVFFMRSEISQLQTALGLYFVGFRIMKQEYSHEVVEKS